MDKFKELMEQCKCGIFLTVNEHRDYYQTAEEYLKENDDEETDAEITKEMIEKNTIISLQFYPRTPVGSYRIFGADIDKVFDEAIEILKLEVLE
jgi:hypothetical protein